MDEAGVRRVVAETNKDLHVQIKDLVSSSISDLKRSNKSIASQQISEIKRLKRDSVLTSTKRAMRSCTNLTKLLKMALKMPRLPSNAEKTKQALDKGMDLLQERQKLILLADKSQYGWKMVLEYKHHHLPNDKDEKKIYKAESRAARSTKRINSRSIQQGRDVALTSTTVQLSASQLPIYLHA